MHRAGDPRATRAGRALTRHRHGDTLQEQGGIEGDRSPAARAQPRTVGHGTGGRRRLRCCVGVQRREMRWTACTHRAEHRLHDRRGARQGRRHRCVGARTPRDRLESHSTGNPRVACQYMQSIALLRPAGKAKSLGPGWLARTCNKVAQDCHRPIAFHRLFKARRIKGRRHVKLGKAQTCL